MRVIAGSFGGRRLVTPPGMGTRPTTEKVRQAVFNSLTSSGELEGAVVADLFAGSGALGLEALSRGAATCVFVERDRQALAALEANIAALGVGERCRVRRGDVMSALGSITGLDIALIDPPYAFADWAGLLGRLDAALAVAESGAEIEAPDGWTVRRSRRYGHTWVSVLDRLA